MPHIAHTISNYFQTMYTDGWNYVNHMDRQQWMFMLFVTMVIGFFFMRGVGLKKNG